MAGGVVISWEPVPITAGDVAEAAERATWGVFKIAVDVDGERVCVTRREDVEGRTVLDGVYGPAVGIAEWFARAWGHLVYARRRPLSDARRSDARREAYLWSRVHELRMAGDGLALPALSFTPVDDGRIELRWTADRRVPEHARVRFVESGTVRVEVLELREAISSFVDGVVGRLRAVCPGDERATDLMTLWDAASGCVPEHEPYKVACRLGLLWTALPPEALQVVRELSRGRDFVTEAVLERIPAGQTAEWLTWARRRAEDLGAARASPSSWVELWTRATAVPRVPTTTPWARGWDDARRLRQLLGAADTTVPSVDDLEARIGLDAPEDVLMQERESLVAWRAGHGASSYGHGRRSVFQRARDVHPPLWGPGPRTDSAALFSKLVPGSSSTANAFAAEWLAPHGLIVEALAGRTRIDDEDVATIATEVGAPYPCVRHQIENRSLAAIGP